MVERSKEIKVDGGGMRMNEQPDVNPSSGKPIRDTDKQHKLFKLTNNVGDNNCFLNVFL